MAGRVSWWWCPGLVPEPVIDTRVHDGPLLRKLPILLERLEGVLPGPSARSGPGGGRPLAGLLPEMDRAAVTTSLVVLYEEVEEFVRLARAHPGRFYGLPFFDSLHPIEGLARVQALAAEHPDLVVGVATAFPFFRQDPRHTAFAPLYDYCTERALPIQFHTGGDPALEALSQPTTFGVLAHAYPRLPIVCLHAGGGGHAEMPDLLRRFPNLYLELEGLQNGELDDAQPRILHALAARAPRGKLMFGSNWMQPSPAYAARVAAVRTLPRRRRAELCWRTAAALYGRPIGRNLAASTLHPPR